MRLTVAGLRAQLAFDDALKVLIVEGERDIRLWEKAFPRRDRSGVVIYAARDFEEQTGTRSAKKELYAICASFPPGGRVLGFADADWDRINRVSFPDGVLSTDGRDSESYFLDEYVLDTVSRCAFGESMFWPAHAAAVSSARSIAAIRISSERFNWGLPFQKTFAASPSLGGGANDAASRREVLGKLLDHRDNHRRFLADAVAHVEPCVAELRDVEDSQLVHGKDYVRLLGRALRVEDKTIFTCFTLALDSREMSRHPSIRRVLSWAAGFPIPAGVSSGVPTHE
jgi:hypothetical protein